MKADTRCFGMAQMAGTLSGLAADTVARSGVWEALHGFFNIVAAAWVRLDQTRI